jgi:hypothetical protein
MLWVYVGSKFIKQNDGSGHYRLGEVYSVVSAHVYVENLNQSRPWGEDVDGVCKYISNSCSWFS